MMTFLKIAWRNIIRNKWRSFITISAIAVGLGALIIIRALIEGIDCQMIENYTDLVTSHIQIHIKGFHKKMGLERSISEPEKIIARLKEEDKLAFSQRIKNYVLVSSVERSRRVLLLGIQPSREPQVSSLHTKIRKGRFLSLGEDNSIILGKDLCEALNVDLGEKVVITTQDINKELVGGAFRVIGIIEAGTEEIDKGVALVTLEGAQKLLGLDNRISEIAIRTYSVFGVDLLAQKLRKKINPSKFEVLTWKEISPMTAQWLEFDRAFINGILLILLIIISAGILNTLLMGVFERIREFGVMLALGTKKRELILMVILESSLLGLIGVGLGSILGGGISFYFNQRGINFAKFGSAFKAYYTGSVIYPRIYPSFIFTFSIIVFIISIVVSIYPAWKAARLRPIEAIRYF